MITLIHMDRATIEPPPPFILMFRVIKTLQFQRKVSKLTRL